MVITAKIFLENKGILGQHANIISEWMIEFAKLHVNESLKCAADNAELISVPFTNDETINHESILTSYLLDNVK